MLSRSFRFSLAARSGVCRDRGFRKCAREEIHEKHFINEQRRFSSRSKWKNRAQARLTAPSPPEESRRRPSVTCPEGDKAQNRMFLASSSPIYETEHGGTFSSQVLKKFYTTCSPEHLSSLKMRKWTASLPCSTPFSSQIWRRSSTLKGACLPNVKFLG